MELTRSAATITRNKSFEYKLGIRTWVACVTIRLLTLKRVRWLTNFYYLQPQTFCLMNNANIKLLPLHFLPKFVHILDG